MILQKECYTYITVFIVLSIAHDNQNPAMTVVSINKVFPCTKKNDNWIEAKSFRVGEDINICGRITSTDPNGTSFIEVRVYQKEAKSQRDAVFYKSITINNGNVIIPINIELTPDIYIAEITG